jgi:ribonuclease HII
MVASPPVAPRASGAATTRPPTLRLERRCWQAGDQIVCGIDEVGRGAWAGPVTVGAVVPAPTHLKGVRDSKELTREERERAAIAVAAWAVAIGVGHASHEECDELGMTAALRVAGRRALAALLAQGFEPDRIILDGKHDYLGLGARVTTLIKADTTSLAVAAASCVAKVARDALMVAEAEHYPAYGFESNVGYPAPVHKAALAGYGPSAIHRRSWIFMEGLCWRGLPPPPGRLFL